MNTKVIATKVAVDPHTELLGLLNTVAIAEGSDRIEEKTAQLLATKISTLGDFYKNTSDGKTYVSLESLASALTSVLRDNVSQVSDGSHTFDELYDHRCLLFIALMKLSNERDVPEIHDVWFSQLHHDGTSFDGYIIVGMLTDTGQCTYHVKEKPFATLLRSSSVREIANAPEWDGHNSSDVLNRLCNAYFNKDFK